METALPEQAGDGSRGLCATTTPARATAYCSGRAPRPESAILSPASAASGTQRTPILPSRHGPPVCGVGMARMMGKCRGWVSPRRRELGQG